jgi:23S rRNA (adenine2030-N6)-methyltransferase
MLPLRWLTPRRTLLSYQHMYHAGNPADLHKHTVLAGCLAALSAPHTAALRRQQPLWFADTHAGQGVYDLTSPEALKTGDATRGFLRISTNDLSASLRQAVLGTARFGPRASAGSSPLLPPSQLPLPLPPPPLPPPPMLYPGSPAVAQAVLPRNSPLYLFERHPAEFRALRRNFAFVRQAVVEQTDGPARLVALAGENAELAQQRGLVLVDPSYEVKSEMAATAEAVLAIARALPLAAILVWYPILPAATGKDSASLCTPLEAAFPATLLKHEVRFPPSSERGLQGSGLLLLNYPLPADHLFRAAAKVVAKASHGL